MLQRLFHEVSAIPAPTRTSEAKRPRLQEAAARRTHCARPRQLAGRVQRGGLPADRVPVRRPRQGVLVRAFSSPAFLVLTTAVPPGSKGPDSTSRTCLTCHPARTRQRRSTTAHSRSSASRPRTTTASTARSTAPSGRSTTSRGSTIQVGCARRGRRRRGAYMRFRSQPAGGQRAWL